MVELGIIYPNPSLSRSYKPVRHELCIPGRFSLREGRIVIPSALRQNVIKLTHSSLSSVVPTKKKPKSNVWWPNMDNAVAES